MFLGSVSHMCCAGVILTDSVPAISAILSVGTIVFLFYRVLSVPFGVMSSYAAQGNMVLASALSVLLWYLSHLVVATASSRPELFYFSLCMWAGAFVVLLLSDWIWPDGLSASSASERHPKRSQTWQLHPDLGPDAQCRGYRGLKDPLLGSRGSFRCSFESLCVPRGLGMFLVNGVLWAMPAVAVLGSMGVSAVS